MQIYPASNELNFVTDDCIEEKELVLKKMNVNCDMGLNYLNCRRPQILQCISEQK